MLLSSNNAAAAVVAVMMRLSRLVVVLCVVVVVVVVVCLCLVLVSYLSLCPNLHPFHYHSYTGKYNSKGAFLLCKTSNPGSNDFLSLNLSTGMTLYEQIASRVGLEWSRQNTTEEVAMLGLVVGATDPTALQKARAAAGQNVWILAPGVGAQGGDLFQALQAGLNQAGTGMLIPVSRGISQAADPAAAAQKLVEQIQSVRQQIVQKAAATTTTTTTTTTVSAAADKNSSSCIQPYQREFLEFSLQQGVLKFGSFVLKSGRTSPYFFNAGLFATGASLFKLAKAYASTIMASDKL